MEKEATVSWLNKELQTAHFLPLSQVTSSNPFTEVWC